jgi:hypothetical protein
MPDDRNPNDPLATFTRHDHPPASPGSREAAQLRARVSTMVRDPAAFTVPELLAFHMLGTTNLAAMDEYRKVLREGYTMAVGAYRDFARHPDCTEDEAEFLVIASDIVEGKAP